MKMNDKKNCVKNTALNNQPAKHGEVSSLLDQLSIATSELEASLETLLYSIRPVMALNVPSSGESMSNDSSGYPSMSSEIGDKIYNELNRIRVINARVYDASALVAI